MSQVTIDAILSKGHQVASGKAINSPFPEGTISMQIAYFLEKIPALSECFLATLNVDIQPKTFSLIHPTYTFQNIKWSQEYAAEDFSLTPCTIIYDDKEYASFHYYPHPETKIGHFHNDSILEVIAPYIEGIQYGDLLKLQIDKNRISI